MTRVCFWATAFQGDVQALAHHLAAHARFEVLVVVPGADAYHGEAVAEVMPFAGRMLDRADPDAVATARAFEADLVVVDNHLPPERLGPRIAVLWHGFGWRVDELTAMLHGIAQAVGDPSAPSAAFRWFATGDFDRQHRIERWNIAPDNVVALGAPLSDWLVAGSDVRRRLEASSAAATVEDKPTVLLAFTWHFGAALSQWGDDEGLTERYLGHLRERDATVVWRMHDRRRYEWRYRRRVERLAKRFDVELKYKDEAPDTVVDIVRSDVVVSNYSSLINAVYFTGKPTVHIDPTPPGHHAYPRYRSMRFGRPRVRAVADPATLWKLPFTEHGGLRATDFAQLIEQTDRALDDPDCCAERAAAFVDRYYTGVDGATCARYADSIERWLSA